MQLVRDGPSLKPPGVLIQVALVAPLLHPCCTLTACGRRRCSAAERKKERDTP